MSGKRASMDARLHAEKGGKLGTWATQKPTAEPSASDAPPPSGVSPKRDERIGQTLRLKPEAAHLLDELELELRRGGMKSPTNGVLRKHDLLIEAVNDLFVKYGKPPLA